MFAHFHGENGHKCLMRISLVQAPQCYYTIPLCLNIAQCKMVTPTIFF